MLLIFLVARQYNDMHRKHLDLQVKNEQLETELFEKNEKYSKLTEVSKALYKEYEMLKNKYETETGAMTKALKDASVWYKENKELKRRTMLLLDGDTVDEGVDAGEAGSDADIENLNKTIKQLSSEVAELQTEVDSLKHIEFITSEQNIKLSEELENEKEKNSKLEHEFIELKKEYEQIIRVSEMMKKELTNLKEIEENQRNNVVILRREADDYKKERNILKHQSTLLLQGFNSENEEFILLIQEIEQLKRTMEEERGKYEDEINSLQEKLEIAEKNSQVEVLEERLKLAESDLQEALERAEKAEDALTRPPAPPPPPPPSLISSEPPVVPLRVKRRSRVNISELADAIGVKEPIPECKKATTGVNDDIINVIKSGKFTLKKVKNENKKEREGSKAVSEILNILGSLRKAPKSRQSQAVGDVLL
ncbi:shootin-1 [Asbolus verrucosus]|uniref:Shootin-1 n=1 Tax=Asbolus verrucosus TaxID=1661398 RepID=A0A482VG02_ASBVE|nr:shootin-1 [Asbolus verrucosus]